MILYQVIDVYQDDIVGTEVTVRCSSFNKDIIDKYIADNSYLLYDTPYQISEIDIPDFDNISIYGVERYHEDDYGHGGYLSPMYLTLDKENAEAKKEELSKYFNDKFRVSTYPLYRTIY